MTKPVYRTDRASFSMVAAVANEWADDGYRLHTVLPLGNGDYWLLFELKDTE